MPTTYFTADLHFGHAGIINMCERPYSTIDEHDAGLIANWNARVQDDDIVYVIGDFAYRANRKRAAWIFSQLRGVKHLIRGNHDHKHGENLHPTQQLPWASISERLEILADDGKTTLVLDHYSLRVWRNMRRGAVQLFGHSHGNLPGSRQSIDVGVDVFGYRPVTWSEIKQRLDQYPPIVFHDGTDAVEQLQIRPGPNSLMMSRAAGGGIAMRHIHADMPAPFVHASRGAVPAYLSGEDIVVSGDYAGELQQLVAELRSIEQPNAVRVSMIDGKLSIVGTRLGDGEYPRLEDGALIIPARWDHDAYAIDEAHVEALREMLSPSAGMKP